jgi:hypothetical protein
MKWPAVGLLSAALFATHRAVCQDPKFSGRMISSDYTYSFGVAAADLDKDGNTDIVSPDCTTQGSRKHNDIYWYQNDGKGNFTRHLVASDGWYGRYERLQIADINADGNPDVVIVDNFFGDVSWFENDGHPRDEKLWKRHAITSGGLLGAYDVAVADFDGDGLPDVVASSWRLGNSFVWYKHPGPGATGEWTAHVIDIGQQQTRGLAVADFNGDGRPDVVGTVTGAGIVLWYENPSDPEHEPWKRHVIDLVASPAHVFAVDLDKDGDTDVVAAIGAFNYDDPASAQVVWYENVGHRGSETRWVKHVIAQSFPQALDVTVADLRGQGHLDVIATAWTKQGRIAWFDNAGDPTGPWTMHSLINDWDGAQTIAVDLDNDGKVDILGTSEKLIHELRWWKNEGNKPR